MVTFVLVSVVTNRGPPEVSSTHIEDIPVKNVASLNRSTVGVVNATLFLPTVISSNSAPHAWLCLCFFTPFHGRMRVMRSLHSSVVSLRKAQVYLGASCEGTVTRDQVMRENSFTVPNALPTETLVLPAELEERQQSHRADST